MCCVLTFYVRMLTVLLLVCVLQVPEGLELAVGSMKAGEHAIVTVTDPTLTAVPEGRYSTHS